VGFLDKFADLEITVLVMSCNEVEQRVISSDVDLGFVASQPRSRSFSISVVAEDRLTLAVPKGHPLSDCPSVKLDELARERFIVREPGSATRALTEKRIFQKHLDWRFRLQINHIDAIKSSLEEGLGISFLSKRAINRELLAGTLAIVHVEGVNLRRPICMLANPQNIGSKAAISFAKHITNHALQIPLAKSAPEH
jgi:DNA-binding transcriptional LysR family regulator